MTKPKAKHAKRAKKGKKTRYPQTRRLEFAEDGDLYAVVLKNLGDCRMELECSDNNIRIGVVRGKFRKRVWIKQKDIVLASLRSFQDDKVDIIHKYNDSEAKQLANLQEIPENWIDKSDSSTTTNSECMFSIGDDDSESGRGSESGADAEREPESEMEDKRMEDILDEL